MSQRPNGHRLVVVWLGEDRRLAEDFQELAAEWRAETAHLSDVDAIAMHPAYQQIIGMGAKAVPLILRELAKRPDHWFWALAAITRSDPVHPDDAGDVSRMTEAWIRYGRTHGYIQ